MDTKLENNIFVDSFKPKKIEGVPVVYTDRPGRNTNIFPKDEVLKGIDFYKRLVELDPTYKYSFAKHPKNEDEEWIGLLAGVVDDIYYDDREKVVKADFTLLPTIYGRLISWLIDNGYFVGVSIRGDAKSTPDTYKTQSGKILNINRRYDLKLEGIDFVVYPSFVTTHVNHGKIVEKTTNGIKPDFIDLDETYHPLYDMENNTSDNQFSRVLESFALDVSKETGMNTEEIMDLFHSSENKQRLFENRRKTNMSYKLEPKEVELQVKQLAFEKEKIEHDIQSSKEELDSITASLEDLNQKLQKKESIVTGLSKLENSLKEKQSELEETLEKKKKEFEELTAQYNETKEKLEEVKESYTKFLEKASKGKVVYFAGKSFSSDNPPKIRVVPISERVSDTEWGNVNKDKLKQIVSLVGDEKLAKQLFGLVDGDPTDEDNLKYPVYQLFKSKEEGYDIDAVLNKNGLKTALVFMQGRAGMALTKKEKKALMKFLLSKYQEIEKEGLGEIPKSLRNVAERVNILDRFEIDDMDDFATPVIESAVTKGFIEIEDESSESKIVVDKNIAYKNIVNAIINTLIHSANGEVKEQSTNNVKADTDNLPEVNLAVLVDKVAFNEDGTPSTFGEAFNIEDVASFQTNFIDKLVEFAKNDDFLTILSMTQALLSAYLGRELPTQEVLTREVIDEKIKDVFAIVMVSLSDMPKEEEEEKGENKKPEEPLNPEENKNQKFSEKTGGNEDMLFEQLKTMMENNFEGITINSEEELIKATEKLMKDYQETFMEVQAMELERVKESKIRELADSVGLDIETIKAEFEDVSDMDELEKVADKLLKLGQKFHESRSRKHENGFDFIPTGGKARVKGEKNNHKDSINPLFSKLMKSV